MNSKAISPIVSLSLLIVVSVFAVISFQSWFGTYSSDLFVQTEQSSQGTSNTNIETLIGDQLYFKNNYDENISIKQIKIGEKECNISVNVSSGISTISLGTCIDNLNLDSNIEDIVIITDKEIYTKKHLFKDVKISSSPLVQNFIDVGYNFSPEGLFYGQNWLLINATANSSIQSCLLNFNGTINTSFTIQNNNCWINQPLNSFGNYTYNVTIIANNSAQNTTISKILNYAIVYGSCKQILDAGQSVGDGIYQIDPDGSSLSHSLSNVYCDMSGGGWTLVVGIDSSNRNQRNSNEVNSENLVNINGKGKFSDSFINAVQTLGNNQIKLNCWNGGYNELDTYSNCNFNSVSIPVPANCRFGSSWPHSGGGVEYSQANVRGTSYASVTLGSGGCRLQYNWGGLDGTGRLWAR